MKKFLGKSEVPWLIQKGHLVLLDPAISCVLGSRCLGGPCLGQDAAWGREQRSFLILPEWFPLTPSQAALSEGSHELLTQSLFLGCYLQNCKTFSGQSL